MGNERPRNFVRRCDSKPGNNDNNRSKTHTADRRNWAATQRRGPQRNGSRNTPHTATPTGTVPTVTKATITQREHPVITQVNGIRRPARVRNSGGSSAKRPDRREPIGSSQSGRTLPRGAFCSSAGHRYPATCKGRSHRYLSWSLSHWAGFHALCLAMNFCHARWTLV